MKLINRVIIPYILLIFSSSLIYGQINSPSLEIVKSIADRVIKDCRFEFELVKQNPVLGLQIINFKEASGPQGLVYALSSVKSDSDSVIKVGISSSPDVTIYVNDKKLIFRSSTNPVIKEIAYGMINFDDTIKVKLNSGSNKILIRSKNINAKVFIRQITDDPESEGWIKFSEPPISGISGTSGWLHIGPFSNQPEDLPENSIKNFYKNGNEYLTWYLPGQNLIPELKINPDNVFKKDSYADWNYANGETILSILELGKFSGEEKYQKFVKRWCDFIINNIPYFRYQYDSLHALRGSYHRIFRKSMLDDAGAPTFPFLQIYINKKEKKYYDLISEMADYVMNKQTRLENGTLCRPEPEKWTVWADDLFMSVPLMLRMGKITGEKEYFDEAVKQIMNFNLLLFNRDKGIYKHGWFSWTNKTSPVFWGRANGWIMWAVSEALAILPKDYEGYSDILKIYKNHVGGLLKYQDRDGMWHQVLDHPDSYEETSCTAMFVLGIARGVNNGWLNKSYSEFAIKGWKALTKKIEPGGIVNGICRGTGMGENLKFYFNRPTIDNDPRGLGAVITAGIEISKLEN
jgi:unsaturated rhamnogalacturonyl hydrolase